MAITAAAGFVGSVERARRRKVETSRSDFFPFSFPSSFRLPASVLIGVAAAVISNYATQLKSFARCDDVMDVFAVHALAGIVGLLLTGIFAQASVAANDGYTEIPGGWLDGHWIQLPKQIAWCAVCAGWTGLMTYILMSVFGEKKKKLNYTMSLMEQLPRNHCALRYKTHSSSSLFQVHHRSHPLRRTFQNFCRSRDYRGG